MTSRPKSPATRRHGPAETEATATSDKPFPLRFGRRPDQVVMIQPPPPDGLSEERREAIRRAVIETMAASPVRREGADPIT